MCITDRLAHQNISTPHLIYDERILLENIQILKNNIGADVFFALKSCYNKDVLSFIAKSGCGAETMSENEYHLAQKTGFEPKNIILNGLGRSLDLLERALDEGSIIIVDSPNDLKRIQSLSKNKKIIRLGLRLDLGLGERMGSSPYGELNKLGSYDSDELYREFFSILMQVPNATFEVLHVHFTINEKNLSIYDAALKEIDRHIANIRSKWPKFMPKKIDIGGGFFPFYRDQMKDAVEFFKGLNLLIEQNLGRNQKIIIEPGRFISNSCGIVLTKVLDKKSKGRNNYIIVDAGTNVLIPIPSVHYRISPINHKLDMRHASRYIATVCDGITSPTNIIVRDAEFPVEPEIGDRILIENAGAYTDVLSEFWVYDPYPVSYLKKDGEVVQSRTLEDIKNARKALWGI